MALNDIKVPRENAQGTFDEITLPDATTSARGLLTGSDKTKLDGIASGATANTASTATPSALGVAAAGSGTAYAREDHVHAMPSAADVGAMSQLAATDQTLTSASTTLTAGRARRLTLSTVHSGTTEVVLPTTSNQNADLFQLIRSNTGLNQTINVTTSAGGSTLASLGGTGDAGRSFTFRYQVGPNSWFIVPVDAHGADKIISGTLDIARIPTGTGSTQVALGDHTHTQLHDKSHTMTDATSHTAGTHKVFYSDGSGNIQELALGATGTVLTSGGTATAPSFAAASGGDTVSIEASASDILSVASGAISAEDAGADRIVFWDDSASALKYLEAGSGLSISGTTLTATASGGSKTYAVFTAEHNQPPSANFATLDTRNSIAVLDFDDATDESAVFVGIMPEGASLGSGLKIRLHWMATSATSNNCVWDVSLERMTTDLDSNSFDTIASATAAANGTSGILTVTEITLTTIDSVTAGDGFRLKVTRDANNGSDNLSGDVELVCCEVRSAA